MNQISRLFPAYLTVAIVLPSLNSLVCLVLVWDFSWRDYLDCFAFILNFSHFGLIDLKLQS